MQNWRKSILGKCKIKINPRAIRELDSIYEYMANEKLTHENAMQKNLSPYLTGLDFMHSSIPSNQPQKRCAIPFIVKQP